MNKIYKQGLPRKYMNNKRGMSKKGTRILTSYLDNNFITKENQRFSEPKKSRIFLESKRSQLTLFIIIAIVIVAVVLILFWGRIGPIIGLGGISDPEAYMQDCLKEKVEEAISLASARGGSIAPVHAISYQGEQVEYLCYTNEYYKTCTTQQPLLKKHFEYEVSKYIQGELKNCMSSFEQAFEKKGYAVSVGKVSGETEIIPNSVNIIINTPVTLSKEDEVLKYNKLKMNFKSEIYDLLMISTSILNWEARYGDSAPESFMVYYPNLKIQKLKQQDGSKIYILTDLVSEESFRFASRSLSWPAGYGIGQRV